MLKDSGSDQQGNNSNGLQYAHSKNNINVKRNHDAVAAALAMVAARKKQTIDGTNGTSYSTEAQKQHLQEGSVTAGAAALERARSAITAVLQNNIKAEEEKISPSPLSHHSSNPSGESNDQSSAAPSAGSAAHLLAAVAAQATPSPSSAVMSSANKSLPVSNSTSPVPQRSSSSKKKGPPLRRGKWTTEEEAYAIRLIQEFKAGLLPLTDGTTLRTFLSKLLNCDPMRISKKFVGSNCIGKQVFRRRTADINRLTPEQIQHSRAELSE